MKNRFKDKKISILGDSLSTYEGYIPNGYPSFYSMGDCGITGIYGYKDTWWGQVLRYFDAELLINNSWSGSFVCSAQSYAAQSCGCGDMRTGALHDGEMMPEHIIICMGANDRGRGIYTKMFEEDYCTMLDKIIKNYPNAEIWCCTLPILQTKQEFEGVFLRVRNGIKAEEYNEVIAAAAKNRRLHMLDIWDESEPLETVDGLHPSYLGMKKIADMVIEQMEKGTPLS